MADIVNLRMARKRKARDERSQVAAENRALHGRSKGDRLRDEKEAIGSAAFLAGHRRERAEPDPET